MKGKPARGSSEASPLGAFHPDRARRASLGGGRAKDRRTPLGRMAGASLRLAFRIVWREVLLGGQDGALKSRGGGEERENGECSDLSLLLPEKPL